MAKFLDLTGLGTFKNKNSRMGKQHFQKEDG